MDVQKINCLTSHQYAVAVAFGKLMKWEGKVTIHLESIVSFFLDHCSIKHWKCNDGYSSQRSSQVISSSFPLSCDWKWWCLSGWVVCCIISQSFSTSLTHSGRIVNMSCGHYYTDRVISQSQWYSDLLCMSFVFMQ